MSALQLFFAAYMEWLGIRKGLKGRELHKFERWVARVYPELFQPYRSTPALFRMQCREIVRASSPPHTKSIGMTTLRRHAEALSHLYLSLPNSERGTYAAFLERVLEQCATERALLRFLGQNQQQS